VSFALQAGRIPVRGPGADPLALYFSLQSLALPDRGRLPRSDGLAFVSFLISAVALFQQPGVAGGRSRSFAGFQVPIWRSQAFAVFLQHASAELSYVFISLTGTPIFRIGLTFVLPGRSITVAEECSGLHSSFVLIITSLVAGYLLLRRPWSRAVFVLATIPFGIARNAFRILTIAWLTVNVDPDSSMVHCTGAAGRTLYPFVNSFVGAPALVATVGAKAELTLASSHLVKRSTPTNDAAILPSEE
jgi:exosortase/archaeosortase family protein